MKLLAFGCSYTIGAFSQRHIEPATYPAYPWPDRLGQLINCEVVNKGQGGVGNFYIANQVYNTVHDDSLVMVMWSGMDRVGRLVSKKEFLQYDESNDYTAQSSDGDEWIHGSPTSFVNPLAREKDKQFWKTYFSMFHTEEDSYIQTLHYMVGVQEFLINRDIPYLFLTFRDIFTNRYGKYKRAKKLEDNIIWDKFHFPNGKFGGMDEWVREDKLHPRLKFTKDYHPSEKMHHKFAEYLYNLKELRYLFT